jgi:uncharacterized protein (DUF433 family)
MRTRPPEPMNTRELPAYSIAEAAHYLRMPTATLRSWVLGRYYPAGHEQRFFRPVIELPDRGRPRLSFVNLVEAHVLDAIRRDHEVALKHVRTALAFLAKHKQRSRHPLAEQDFVTDKVHLFIEEYGRLINISRDGQLAMRSVVDAYLERIERDAKGLPIRLFPFTRRRTLDEPRAVVIDPTISFGRPVLIGTGIPTAVIAERYKAGDSMDALAADYGRTRLEIEEAVRCELQVEAA